MRRPVPSAEVAAIEQPRREEKHSPRIVCYHQTQWNGDQYVSMLPLSRGGRKTTHVIIAAIHLNNTPGDVTLNDDPWNAPKNVRVWQEVNLLQKDGVKVLGMLGGAAKGSFSRLDFPLDVLFRSYYEPLRQMLLATGLDGVDLDVEEHMSLTGIMRLIDQLRRDFGPTFIITLAPVCAAMQNKRHISGFNYEELEAARGPDISFYNTQFYNGWGYIEDSSYFDAIMARGWPQEKIVIGMLTNPESGRGWVPDDMLRATLLDVRRKYPDFGGVMGWEYFNSITAAAPFGWPWSWADLLTDILYPPEKFEKQDRDIHPGEHDSAEGQPVQLGL